VSGANVAFAWIKKTIYLDCYWWYL